MFGFILTIFFTLALSYVVWRSSSIPVVGRRARPAGLVGFGAACWLIFFLGRGVLRHGTTLLSNAVELFGMLLLGSIFVVATAFLIVDLFTLFGWALRKWTFVLRGVALASGLTLSAFAVFQGLRPPALVSHEVVLRGLPKELDGIVLAAVSDAHVGSRRQIPWLESRMKEVEALRPDIVVFLGDMFEGRGDIPKDIAALERLKAPLGKWFVDGNHESHGDENRGAVALTRAGFRKLEDSWAEPAPGLILAGVRDLTVHKRRGQGGDPLGRALGDRPKGATVLLSHTPWEAERAARMGVGLMLSGHTHGGQIWPFGYLVRAVYPLFVGRYEVDGMTAIVSRGAGTWGPPMRLWRSGEILKVRLLSRGR